MITHTHFSLLGINLPIAQDICYTGFSGRSCFVYFGRLHKVFSVNAKYIRTLWKVHLKFIFQLHAHLLHKRIVSDLFLCNHFGPHTTRGGGGGSQHLLRNTAYKKETPLCFGPKLF